MKNTIKFMDKFILAVTVVLTAVCSCAFVCAATIGVDNSTTIMAEADEVPDIEPVEVVDILEADSVEEEAAETDVDSVEDDLESEEVAEEPSTDISTYYDVPLSEDLQNYIFELCETRGIRPTIVIAIIEKESRYDSDAVGDNGNSIGLMQIQPKWHYARMIELGCTDLTNPYDNAAVGIDILTELYATGASTEWVLTAYNGGVSYANTKAATGEISSYAEAVKSIEDRVRTAETNS